MVLDFYWQMVPGQAALMVIVRPPELQHKLLGVSKPGMEAGFNWV
jgi:hypothetical protein